jgi:hypothetical protein
MEAVAFRCEGTLLAKATRLCTAPAAMLNLPPACKPSRSTNSGPCASCPEGDTPKWSPASFTAAVRPLFPVADHFAHCEILIVSCNEKDQFRSVRLDLRAERLDRKFALSIEAPLSGIPVQNADFAEVRPNHVLKGDDIGFRRLLNPPAEVESESPETRAVGAYIAVQEASGGLGVHPQLSGT